MKSGEIVEKKQKKGKDKNGIESNLVSQSDIKSQSKISKIKSKILMI